MVVLKAAGEELDRIINYADKLLARMGHVSLLGGSSNTGFLSERCKSKEHHFGFIGYRSIEVWNGLNDVFDNILNIPVVSIGVLVGIGVGLLLVIA